MTPYELVASRYGLPFPPYNYQELSINALAPLQKSGHYLAVGVGKTLTSTAGGLYKLATDQVDRVIVLMPPILLVSWYRWLTCIKGVTAMVYAGDPKKRKAMTFDKDFILMSYDIFKRDYDRITAEFDMERTCLICDEATAIKNVESKNYQRVRDFAEIGHLMLLTGTPLSKVLDGYAYVKLLAPTVYRSYTQFENIHIAKHDFFGTPIEFKNLELLEKAMKVNSIRILKEDVLDQLPEIQYTPLHYDLDPKHLALYHKLAEEQLLELENGEKIDATQTTRLWHSLQQIVMNWDHFSGDMSSVSMGFHLVDQIMDELDSEKLIIFTNYKLTSAKVAEYTKKYGSVSVWGEVTPANKQKAIDKFMTDPTTRVIVVQVKSGGYGLNLQDCCADVLFLESPLIPADFEQAVGRVYRNGQKKKVHVRVGIAQGTIQLRLLEVLMKKDSLVNRVVRNHKDIRDALFGLPLAA